MQALTPELLAAATSKLLAQLPGSPSNFSPSSVTQSSGVASPSSLPAFPSEAMLPTTGFAPASVGSPVAGSLPSQSSAPATPSHVPFSRTPSRPPGTPAVPRTGFAAAEMPAAFVPPLESQTPHAPSGFTQFASGVPGLSGFGLQGFPGFAAFEPASNASEISHSSAPQQFDRSSQPMTSVNERQNCLWCWNAEGAILNRQRNTRCEIAADKCDELASVQSSTTLVQCELLVCSVRP